MAINRELSQFAGFVTIDESGNNNVGIATTVRISGGGGLFVGGVEVISPTGIWKGSSSGLIGSQGAQGAVGAQGAQGAQGAVGAQGAQGAVGSQGAQGAVGSQGAQGAQGATGTVGAQGAQGASGVQGSGGAQGAQGAVGAQGAQGATGSAGAQGVQGASGPTGGSNTQILFNSSGSASGDAAMTFNSTDKLLTMTDGFYANDTELNTTRTFPTSGTLNGGVFGPYTIASGVTLTISSGSNFTIL